MVVALLPVVGHLVLCPSGMVRPGPLAGGGMTAEATGSGGTESGTCALAKVRAPLGTCPWCPLARVDATLVAGPGLLALARVAAGLSRAPGILEFLICRLPM